MWARIAPAIVVSTAVSATKSNRSPRSSLPATRTAAVITAAAASDVPRRRTGTRCCSRRGELFLVEERLDNQVAGREPPRAQLCEDRVVGPLLEHEPGHYP